MKTNTAIRSTLPLSVLAAQFLLAFAASAQVIAPVPQVMNYQGRVTDATGLPIGATGTAAAPVAGTTNRKVIFRIYDAASGGTRLWTEEQTVTISSGEFSVLLGSGIAATGTATGESRPALDTVFNTLASTPGGGRFLEVMVDEGGGTIDASDVPISPRQQLTTSAYAFRAKAADTIASGTDLQLNSSSNYGLGYYGGSRLFNGVALDGPVLYGLGGGVLGSVNGATQTPVLRWNGAGQVGIGSATLAGADAATKLLLQGDDASTPPRQLSIRGATDANKRLFAGYNTTSNYGSLQAYNGVSTAANLVLNGSGGNVGIGTATPGIPLTFADGLGDKISLFGQSGNTYGFGIQSSVLQIHTDGSGGDIAFGYGSSAAMVETMRVKGNGNVGIGIDPSYTLEVNGFTSLGASFSSHFLALGNQFNQYDGSGTSAAMHLNYPGGNVTLAATGTGNVGIGVGGPSVKLNVKVPGGGAPASTGTTPAASTLIRLEDSTTACLDIGGNGGGGFWLNCTNVNDQTAHYPISLNPLGGNVKIGGTMNLVQNAPLSVQTAFAKATAVQTNAFNVATSDAANPFGLGVRLNGHATSTSRTVMLQTGDLDASDQGGLLFQAGGGNVGIGSNAVPTKAKLEVTGWQYTALTGNNGYLKSTNTTTGTYNPTVSNGSVDLPVTLAAATTVAASIWAQYDVLASGFRAFSDERIKSVRGHSDGAVDLALLKGIEVTDYTYIDTLAKGAGRQKKVIAQQVEKVYPQAVSRSTDVVPDIYQKAPVKDGWVTLATNLKKGERVRLIDGKKEGIHEVLEVAEGRFRTDFAADGAQVFVFGREVTDFRNVDYEAISMLNVSATQELARKLEAKDAKIAALEQHIAELEVSEKAAEAAVGSRLAALEKALARSAAATAATPPEPATKTATKTAKSKDGARVPVTAAVAR